MLTTSMTYTGAPEFVIEKGGQLLLSQLLGDELQEQRPRHRHRALRSIDDAAPQDHKLPPIGLQQQPQFFPLLLLCA